MATSGGKLDSFVFYLSCDINLQVISGLQFRLEEYVGPKQAQRQCSTVCAVLCFLLSSL